ncbi:TonB-dependent receptor [Ponticaulis sp.]|uniref:TonB-dependent receptor n=1 Tax=Ponticaulis sp. TaxID=2020902 RepID=UPI000C66BBB6|nr:TonB-dependent receptor [Ponticaulis sp.]MBN03723.1 TonB-dependent receptor [Ponticaulis sp.]
MIRTSAIALLAGLTSVSAYAQTADLTDEENRLSTVEVHGRGLELIGEAQAASQGVVGYADFEDRPLSRAGELVEVIPGVIATQHSGEGKANQFFLRGFNLDHGSDFSAVVDGVPLSMRSHGHGQGYLDLNPIIPELVERVDYQKGPYFADTGDFSVAGAGTYTLYSELAENFVELKVGEDGYLRTVGGYSTQLSETTTLLLAGEFQNYDGPWENAQEVDKISGLARLSGDYSTWNYTLTATAYDNNWVSSEQIPLRAIQSGQISRFGSLDDDLGGDVSRYSLSGQLGFNHGDGASTEISAFYVDSSFSLTSNFTYFLADPVNGDEFHQFDERTIMGGSIRHERELSDRLEIHTGAQLRYDDVSDVGLELTAGPTVLQTVNRGSVEEFSLGVWGEAEYHFTPTLRGSFGLRADYYDGEVIADIVPQNSGSIDDTLVTPNASLAWRASDHVELYASYGRGFHTNDIRGTVIQIDPATGQPATQAPLFSEGEGYELGARFERGDFNLSAALFTLELDSELIFVGDAGTTEINDATTRTGVELTSFWRPNDWLTLDASAAFTDAEFNVSGPDTAIPNAVETVFGGGMHLDFEPWVFTARLRYLGEAPLIEDSSVTTDPTTILNLGASYTWNTLDFGLEVLNALDAEDNDISYFYESQLQGEANPIEDIHFKPVEPRQVRFRVRYNF